MIVTKTRFNVSFQIIFIALFFIRCSSIKNFQGKFVNEKNYTNDYYIFHKQNNEYQRILNDNKWKGVFLKGEEQLVLMPDSLSLYNNINLKFDLTHETTDTEITFVEAKNNSFEIFKSKNPNIKVYFIGFLEGNLIDATSIIEIDSKYNRFIIDDSIPAPLEYFRIIGINTSCLDPNLNLDCSVLNKKFQSKLYQIDLSLFSNKIKIDFSPLLDYDFTIDRSVKVSDSILDNNYFFIDGNKYIRYDD